jgi:hypothetical protein
MYIYLTQIETYFNDEILHLFDGQASRKPHAAGTATKLRLAKTRI